MTLLLVVQSQQAKHANAFTIATLFNDVGTTQGKIGT